MKARSSATVCLVLLAFASAAGQQASASAHANITSARLDRTGGRYEICISSWTPMVSCDDSTEPVDWTGYQVSCKLTSAKTHVDSGSMALSSSSFAQPSHPQLIQGLKGGVSTFLCRASAEAMPVHFVQVEVFRSVIGSMGWDTSMYYFRCMDWTPMVSPAWPWFHSMG